MTEILGMFDSGGSAIVILLAYVLGAHERRLNRLESKEK